jgi:hypothetical protein
LFSFGGIWGDWETTHIAVVKPEERIKGSIVDNTHVSVGTAETMELAVDTLERVIVSWICASWGSLVVGEGPVGSRTSEQVVGTVTDGEAVILQGPLELIGIGTSGSVSSSWVAESGLP